jgi:hypothetical protein
MIYPWGPTCQQCYQLIFHGYWGPFLLVNGTHNAFDLTNDRTTVDTLDGLFFWGATNGKTGD